LKGIADLLTTQFYDKFLVQLFQQSAAISFELIFLEESGGFVGNRRVNGPIDNEYSNNLVQLAGNGFLLPLVGGEIAVAPVVSSTLAATLAESLAVD